MITEIPTSRDFMDSGLSFLDFAWDIVAGLLCDLEEAEHFGVDIEEVTDAYWLAAKQRLTTSLALVQQGIEFILKAKIVDISPYLLIMRDPKEWPGAGATSDLNFAEFRMIDAHDLIKILNTVATPRLDDKFRTRFEELRKKRNAIMHTVDKRIDIHVTDVILEILTVYHDFFPDQSWVRIRRDFLEKAPLSELHSPDHVEPRVIEEFTLVADLLEPAAMMTFFGFNKRQRRYICPHCNRASGDSELRPMTAILRPKSPTSTNLYCFICEESIQVERTDCPEADCPGNVIASEHRICVTCGGSVE
jgi:hypothetical protein